MGPVFATRSKENPDPVVGPELVRARARAAGAGRWWRSAASRRENAREVVEAGADGLAVIAAVLAQADLAEAVRRFRRAMGEAV